MKKPLIAMLFIIAALYDGFPGFAFLFSADAVFQAFEVTPPNHFGYVHFPAALLLVFALMWKPFIFYDLVFLALFGRLMFPFQNRNRSKEGTNHETPCTIHNQTYAGTMCMRGVHSLFRRHLHIEPQPFNALILCTLHHQQ